MDCFGVVCPLKRRSRPSRQQNEGRHVDLALYARVRGRRLSERRSHSDGTRRAAAAAPVAKSNVAGPERRAAPGRPPFFFARAPLLGGPHPRVFLSRRGRVPFSPTSCLY